VRSIARDIVKRAEESASEAAAIVREVNLAKLDAARFAVLDLTGDNDAPALASVSTAPAPSIDFAPEIPPALLALPASAPAFDFA
jgi:hypothetical protein